MKPVLLYLLQVIVCSGLLYGYYHLLLRNKKFHRYNRYYLLAAAIISILVPFLNIPVYFDSQNEGPVWLQTLNGTDNYFFTIVAKKINNNNFYLEQYSYSFVCTGFGAGIIPLYHFDLQDQETN